MPERPVFSIPGVVIEGDPTTDSAVTVVQFVDDQIRIVDCYSATGLWWEDPESSVELTGSAFDRLVAEVAKHRGQA